MTRLVWSVVKPSAPETVLVTVVWEAGANGQTPTVSVQGDHADAAHFIPYYLDDPLQQRPVYLEGLGPQAGPHSRTAEQMTLAMAQLEQHFPAYRAIPADQ